MNRRSLFATLAAIPLLSGLVATSGFAAQPAAVLMSREARQAAAGHLPTPTAVVTWSKDKRFMLIDGVPAVVGDLDTAVRLTPEALALAKSWQDAPSSPYITDGTINRAGVALLQGLSDANPA